MREPCNYPQKFPNPIPFLDHYYRGDSLVEAYWKSVEWPGEGLFVGEPLARPFGRHFLVREGTTLRIRTTCLSPGRTYRVVAADSAGGSFTPVLSGISIPHHKLAEIVVPDATRAVYRLDAGN